jgi:hypothetical protein
VPVGYFHAVFTVPHQLSELMRQNKRVLYELLFRSVADTLLEVAANPRQLGAEIGFLCVLHTWGQTLIHHPLGATALRGLLFAQTGAQHRLPR